MRQIREGEGEGQRQRGGGEAWRESPDKVSLETAKVIEEEMLMEREFMK